MTTTQAIKILKDKNHRVTKRGPDRWRVSFGDSGVWWSLSDGGLIQTAVNQED